MIGRGEARGVEEARAALRSYLETILFDEQNPDGDLLRAALIAPRDGKGREEIRRRLLREVDLWGPGAAEWRAIPAGEATVYAGRLLSLYTEVRLDGRGKVEHAVISLD